ncbi:MAG: DMT family transporter [Rhodocyclaceae bacterium]
MPAEKKTHEARREQLIGYLAAGATLVIWTSFVLVSRLGGKSVLTSHDILALRLITASLVLLPFAGSLPQGALRDVRLWALALIGGVTYGVFAYAGFKLVPAAHGGILLSGLQPFLITAVAWLLVGTRPTRLRSIGLSAIAIGVACAAMPYFTHWSNGTLLGDALLLIASITWAFYSVLAKRWGYSAWTLTRAVALGSALLYLPIYALWLPKQLAAAPLSMILIQGLFQGIGATILAMLFFLRAVSSLGAERTAALLALVPVTAGLLAVPLLDEALTGWLVSGLVFVSLGAYIASRPATSALGK